MRSSNLFSITLIVLLFVATAWVRLYQVGAAGAQPDEIHWIKRGYGVLENLRAGKFEHLTTHLNHPGIAPAVVIAVAEAVSESYDSARGLKIGQSGYIDRLTASRTLLALAASLLYPILFLLIAQCMPLWFAFGFALLAALDPMSIGLGRMAHIDATLATLIALLVFLYHRTLKSERTVWPILTGVVWGLAIGIKPTALFAVFAMLGMKFFYNFFYADKPIARSFNVLKEYWIGWLAIATFSLTYTRLWHHYHQGFNRYKLNADSQFKQVVYQFGENLHGYWMPLSVFGILLLAFALHFRFGSARRRPVMGNALLIFLSLAFPYIFFPQVIENLIGYFTWVVGLSEEVHEAWGKVWVPPKYGYIGFFVTRLPSLVVIVALLSLAALVTQLRKLNRNQQFFTLSALCVLVAWTLPLSASDKQAFRYVLPAIPFLYGLIAVVVWQLFSRHLYRFLCLGILLVFQVANVFLWYPDYTLFFNWLSGGVPGALARNHVLPFAGQPEIVSRVIDKVSKENAKYYVGVLGQPETVRYEFLRQSGANDRRVTFVGGATVASSDLAIVTGSFLLDPKEWSEWREIDSYSVGGVKVTKLFELPYPSHRSAFELSMEDSGIQAGRKEYIEVAEEKHLASVGRLGHNAKGYLFYGQDVRVAAGKYRAIFDLSIPSGAQRPDNFALDRGVIRIEVGSRCERMVVLQDLSESIQPIELGCEASGPGYFQLRAYWFGKHPVQISGARIVSANTHSGVQ